MIGDAIAGYIGNKIDRRDGKGGTIGALVGVLGWRVAKRVVPAAIVLGAAAYGARALQRRFSAPAT
ncbi:MAG: hypothetical protein KF730_16995 [Sphingomonas sp.]|uniref:hypothetical protein n=1 Tax=Sphingomonas sp. TaxID=28214 RepID=UPI0025FA3CC1|nr:hypothetical protein [Sphingomonas sp.]MBX3566260.1 hypothetical protein [Sphingomonas sp.]